MNSAGRGRTMDKAEELRSRAIEHLEAALALTDETRDRSAGLLIELALDELRTALWPSLDASWDRVLKR
jgi:hypothetical protein